MNLPTYTCSDNSPKNHRLVLDGGQGGQFALELCQRCYIKEDKKFVIFEEHIDGSSTAAPVAPIPHHNAIDHHKQSVK